MVKHQQLDNQSRSVWKCLINYHISFFHENLWLKLGSDLITPMDTRGPLTMTILYAFEDTYNDEET